MANSIKRLAWLVDDDVLLEGFVERSVFTPNYKGCGFSHQKIYQRDIGRIIFFSIEEALKTGFPIIKESGTSTTFLK